MKDNFQSHLKRVDGALSKQNSSPGKLTKVAEKKR